MTAHATTALPSGLSTRLRAGTADAHRRAEGSRFVEALLAGEVELGAFTELMGQLFFVYETLESAAAVMRRDPAMAAIAAPELDRLPALRADLQALVGPDWRQRLVARPATEAYCARLRENCFDWPGGFLAHHYTRYLGDLSGGQVIATLVRRHHGLDDTTGTQFFVFPEIPKPKVFKDRYRVLVDQLAWDDVEQDRVVAEAVRAFELNGALFADLEGDLGRWLLAGPAAS